MIVIAAATAAVSLVYVWPSYVEFPMDDTYIHFVYARNLAEQGKLIFSFAGEQGVGTTSILWVWLLAAGHALGLSMHLVAKVLGVVSLTIVGLGTYLLLLPHWHSLRAIAGALLLVLSGNVLWFALSGMETMLFLALGIMALVAYREERWGWLGAELGLLTLTRPEGAALALAIGGVEWLRHRRLRRGFAASAMLGLALCGPWFGYLLWRTGHILPTSAIGKQLTFAIQIHRLQETNAFWVGLSRIPGLIYVGAWLVYLAEFALGGMALPPPRIAVPTVAGQPHLALSLWAVLGWAIVVAPLLLAAARQLDLSRLGSDWIHNQARRPLAALLLWAVIHNASYMAFMPVPGTASRYGAVNYIILWLALAGGLWKFAAHPRLRLGLAAGLTVIAAANTAYWNGVYDANIDHMRKVRIAAAHFTRDAFPSGEACAAFDVGALRYHGQRSIVDLGGLVNTQSREWFLKGADQYLTKHRVTCLVLPSHTGTTDANPPDMARIMGLSTSALLTMRLMRVFEIDYLRWRQGYLPTVNYQASVAVYRLVTTRSAGK